MISHKREVQAPLPAAAHTPPATSLTHVHLTAIQTLLPLTLLPSGEVAASTIAWLWMPRMLAGFRLHTSTTRRCCISAKQVEEGGQAWHVGDEACRWHGNACTAACSASKASNHQAMWLHATHKALHVPKLAVTTGQQACLPQG